VLVGVVAAVVVLALAGTGWAFFEGQGSSTGRSASDTNNLAPDFLKKPKLGPKIVVADVLRGNFSKTAVLSFTDDNHVLLSGAGSSGPNLGLLDVDTNKLVWQIDLSQEAGSRDATVGSAIPLGDGSAVVHLFNGSAILGEQSTMVAVSAKGEVMGIRHQDAETWFAADGLVVFTAGNSVAVAQGSDLGKDLWNAKVKAASKALDWGTYNILTGDDGNFYVLTDDGFVDGHTGKNMGYGKDADPALFKVAYQMLPGDATVAVRQECRGVTDSEGYTAGFTCSMIRIDPKNGSTIWSRPIDNVMLGDVVATDGTIVLATNDKQVEGIDADTGDKKWFLHINDVSDITMLNSGWVIVVDGQSGTVFVNSKTGGRGTTLDGQYGLSDAEGSLASGNKVLYLRTDSSDSSRIELTAVSATGDTSSPLWLLPVTSVDGSDLEDGSDYLGIVALSGRMFLVESARLTTDDKAFIQEVVGS